MPDGRCRSEAPVRGRGADADGERGPGPDAAATAGPLRKGKHLPLTDDPPGMPSDSDDRDAEAERPPPSRHAPARGGGTGTVDPGRRGDGPDGLLDRTRGFVRGTARRVRAAPGAWAAYTLWVTLVSVAHFAGLHYRIYWEVWWWDVLTHGTSGAGVAALFPLLGLAAWERRSLTSRLLLAAGVVAAVGVGFEVYERLFRTFWQEWTLAYYLEDTALDVVVDALGAAAFVAVAAAWRSLGGASGRSATADAGGAGRNAGANAGAGAGASAGVNAERDPSAD